MERVTLLIEATGERLSCMLNPDSLVMRRHAGIRPRRFHGGRLGGGDLPDDPLLYTGGGWTELDLDLLFDLSLRGSQLRRESEGEEPATGLDVRELTGPLWELAENVRQRDQKPGPPIVRFMWGRHWNVPGVVLAVAERLEQFAADGAARRSWLRLRLRRVAGTQQAAEQTTGLPEGAEWPTGDEPVPDDELLVHDVGPGETPPSSDERIDVLATRYYGNPRMWRMIASFNGIADPTKLPSGQTLRLPPKSILKPTTSGS